MMVPASLIHPDQKYHNMVLMRIRVVKTDQLFQNSPSKPSNGQPSEGLLQTFFILKAITTSCFELKSKNCPWGKYEMKNLTSPNMANPFN